MVTNVQKELTKFYVDEVEKIICNQAFTEEQAKELSAPFLLSVHDNYLTSDLKVMYVGKETNGWGGKYYDFINNDNCVEKMLLRYDREINNKSRWNNRFFVVYEKLSLALAGGKKGAIAWNNLMKMDFEKKGKGYSRNSKDHSDQLREFSKRLFLKELELLRPHFIVFATSHTYDSVLKDFLQDRQTIEVIEKKALWKFCSHGAVCYRTWHPQTINYKASKTIPEYFQMIIDDIKAISGARV